MPNYWDKFLLGYPSRNSSKYPTQYLMNYEVFPVWLEETGPPFSVWALESVFFILLGFLSWVSGCCFSHMHMLISNSVQSSEGASADPLSYLFIPLSDLQHYTLQTLAALFFPDSQFVFSTKKICWALPQFPLFESQPVSSLHNNLKLSHSSSHFFILSGITVSHYLMFNMWKTTASYFFPPLIWLFCVRVWIWSPSWPHVFGY